MGFLLLLLLSAVGLSLASDGGLLFRPRFEHAEARNDGLKPANALTFRLALWKEGFQNPLGFRFELTAVGVLLDRFYPQREGYAKVAEENRLRPTELYAYYRTRFLELRAGRFRVRLGDERLIGSVDWRQMPQTFDAVALFFSEAPWKFEAYYLLARKGVLNSLSTDAGEDGPFNRSPVLVFSLKPTGGFEFSAYYLDLSEVSETGGAFLGWEGKRLSLFFDYAVQRGGTSGDWASMVRAWVRLGPLTAGFERLKPSFTTPLATLHRFNGYADAFLAYTASSNDWGLWDLYATAVFKTSAGRAEVSLHRFRSVRRLPTGGRDFGRELDLVWTFQPLKNLSLGLKAALYEPDGEGCDLFYCRRTFRFWLWSTFAFSF